MTKRFVAVALLALVASGFAAPAFAKTKADLIAEGYKCEVVSAGFVTCTKSGVKDWWCSGSTCEMAPKTVGPRKDIFAAPLTGLMSR